MKVTIFCQESVVGDIKTFICTKEFHVLIRDCNVNEPQLAFKEVSVLGPCDKTCKPRKIELPKFAEQALKQHKDGLEGPFRTYKTCGSNPHGEIPISMYGRGRA